MTLLGQGLLLQCPQRMIRVALSLDLRKQIPFSLKEERVLKYLLVTAFYFGFVKVVHV